MEIKKIDKNLEFLRQISQEVDFKEDLTSELKDLENYILESNGFAIAAIQLGYKNRVIYVRCSDYTKYDEKGYNEAEIIINPVITNREGLTTYWEACLSCMDNTAIVCRPYKIQLLYYDLSGKKKEKTIEGFPATVLSHEYDHLDGILHMDKGLEVLLMDKDERKEFRKKYGYEVYDQKGKFEELISEYSYDTNSKKMVKHKILNQKNKTFK